MLSSGRGEGTQGGKSSLPLLYLPLKDPAFVPGLQPSGDVWMGSVRGLRWGITERWLAPKEALVSKEGLWGSSPSRFETLRSTSYGNLADKVAISPSCPGSASLQA